MSKMLVAAGDIREIAGQPVFVPLWPSSCTRDVCARHRPKKFVVVSDNEVAKEMLTQATSFSKGILSETSSSSWALVSSAGRRDGRSAGCRPFAAQEARASMVDMFGQCGVYGSAQLARADDGNHGGDGELLLASRPGYHR